jgi:hypothetical protein
MKPDALIHESTELMKVFAAIVHKSEQRPF